MKNGATRNAYEAGFDEGERESGAAAGMT